MQDCDENVLRKKEYLEDLGVDVKIILKCIFKKRDGGMDCFDLVQDRERYGALVNVEINSPIP